MQVPSQKKHGQEVVAGVTTGSAVVLPPLPHSLIIQTGIPENRTKILLRLKDAARALTPYAHQLPAGIQGLNEQIPEAYELCNLIEVCLLHGIRIREFHGVVPLWGLLERLDALYVTPHPTSNSSSSNSSTSTSNSNSSSSSSGSGKSLVSVVSSLSRLRTPLSKARGWIRHALNRRAVDEVPPRPLTHTHISLPSIPSHLALVLPSVTHSISPLSVPSHLALALVHLSHTAYRLSHLALALILALTSVTPGRAGDAERTRPAESVLHAGGDAVPRGQCDGVDGCTSESQGTAL